MTRRQRASIAWPVRVEACLGRRPPARLPQVFLDRLVDGGVEIHRQQHGRGSVDGHRHRGRGRAEVEAGIEFLHVVEGGHRHPRHPETAVDIGASVRVCAVKDDRIEGRRQARGAGQASGLGPAREVVETAVGTLRTTLAREHARRGLQVPARVDAGRIGVAAGQVLLEEEAQQGPPVLEDRQGHRRDRDTALALGVVGQVLVPVPHPVDQARGAIPRRLFRPGPQELAPFLTDLNQGGLIALAEPGPDRIWVGRGRAEIRQRRRKVGGIQGLAAQVIGLGPPCGLCLSLDRLAFLPPLPGDLGEITQPPLGQEGNRCFGRRAAAHGRCPPMGASERRQALAQGEEQAFQAGIVEAMRRGVEHRAALPRNGPQVVLHRAQCIGGPGFVTLVQDHGVRGVEHLDLLELARTAIVRRHDIDRYVDEIDDLGVALPGAGGLDEDQIETERPQEFEAGAQDRAGREVAPAGGHGAQIDARVTPAVHAQAVGEQRTAAPGARGIDGDERHPHGRKRRQEPREQLVDDRALARAPRARDAQDRAGARRAPPVRESIFVLGRAALDEGQGAADRRVVIGPRGGLWIRSRR